jgi:excisionase family DNA binding protein
MAKTESTVSAPSGFLSLDHAAEYADVSVRTLKRWIASGLPKYQAGPGSKVLIRPTDIEAYLTRQQANTPNLNALVDEVVRGLNLD